MTNQKFKVGDRVGLITTKYSSPPEYGTIKEVLSDSKVKVLWDQERFGGRNQQLTNSALLMHEEELKSRYSELEKEYKELEQELKSQVQEAANLLKNAQVKAQSIGVNLKEMYDAIEPLNEVMQDINPDNWYSSDCSF